MAHIIYPLHFFLQQLDFRSYEIHVLEFDTFGKLSLLYYNNIVKDYQIDWDGMK